LWLDRGWPNDLWRNNDASSDLLAECTRSRMLGRVWRRSFSAKSSHSINSQFKPLRCNFAAPIAHKHTINSFPNSNEGGGRAFVGFVGPNDGDDYPHVGRGFTEPTAFKDTGSSSDGCKNGGDTGQGMENGEYERAGLSLRLQLESASRAHDEWMAALRRVQESRVKLAEWTAKAGELEARLDRQRGGNLAIASELGDIVAKVQRLEATFRSDDELAGWLRRGAKVLWDTKVYDFKDAQYRHVTHRATITQISVKEPVVLVRT
jgi:hypothetical protein